jgi:hypothetical protein
MPYSETSGTLMSTKQLAAGQLPPEIWMIIIDMAVESSIIPDEICTYSNLSRLNLYLRIPYKGLPIDQSWANLRLVCGLFKALAGPAPRLYMGRKGVLETARDVRISHPLDVAPCVQQLVKRGPNKRVVALTIPSGGRRDLRDGVAQSILQYGRSLPNLRILTIALRDVDWSKAWGNINEAAPSLTSLVVSGEIEASFAVSFVVEKVVFHHLKMLELHSLLPFVGVEFPALRHVSLDRCSRDDMKVITRWPHLESLLLRTMDRKTGFDWRSFPNLRLLGLPPTHLWIVSRCPYDHPLSHLSLYVRRINSISPAQLVELVMERRPSPTKITLNLETIWEQDHYLDIIAHGCASAGLQLVGSPYSVSRRSALFIAGMVPPSVIDGVKYAAKAAAMPFMFPVFILCQCLLRYGRIFD